MKNRERKVLLAAALVGGGVFLYQKRGTLMDILTVFVYAAAFTLFLSPLCRRLEGHGMKPKTAAVLCMLAFACGVLLLLAAFIPYLLTQTVDLVRRLMPTLSGLLQEGGELLARFGIQFTTQKGLTDKIASGMSHATAVVARGSMAFAAQAGRMIFALVITYYLLCERQRVGNHLLLLVPLRWRTTFLTAMMGCKNAVLNYASGVLKTSLFVGLATFAGLLLLRVRDAFLLGLFMGLFEILPYIGPVLAAVPILLSTLSQGLLPAALAIGVVVLVQQIEGNFISPYFTAVSTSIHPLTALVSVFVMGSLMGLWGILLAVPLVVTARSLFWSIRQAENMIKP